MPDRKAVGATIIDRRPGSESLHGRLAVCRRKPAFAPAERRFIFRVTSFMAIASGNVRV